MSETEFLESYAEKLGGYFDPEGECGIGRECVGIGKDSVWIALGDAVGEVSSPPNAYHKYDCLAVLGRGTDAVTQLYDWCKRLDESGFTEIEYRMPEYYASLPSKSKAIMAVMGTLAPPALVKETEE